jgi:type IV secretory pathway VirB4 component
MPCLPTCTLKTAPVLDAMQQLSDILSSGISDAILEACPTKILLPNAESKSPNSRTFYELVDLNQRELDILQTSIPKRTIRLFLRWGVGWWTWASEKLPCRSWGSTTARSGC